MVLPPLHPAFLRYLASIQSSTTVGVHVLRDGQSVRSVFRWRHDAGEQLLIIPSVPAEALGLHAHVFITEPGPRCTGCQYAVEAAWVTPDLKADVLYLHCLVPVAHRDSAGRLFDALPARAVFVVWSTSGWQSFVDPAKGLMTSVQAPIGGSDADLLRKHPLVVPVVMESFRYPNTMSMIWARIRARDPARLRSYVRGPINAGNGMLHVRDAYHELSQRGLVVQHIVRYHPLLAGNIELFVVLTGVDALTEILPELLPVLRNVETYPTGDGFLCRLLGSGALLDRIVDLPPVARSRVLVWYLHTKRHPPAAVGFAYDALFDPRTGDWASAS